MSDAQRIRKRLAELPFRLPLLDALLADDAVHFRFRAIDWSWDGYKGLSVATGFNPLLREIYVPVGSPVGAWCLRDMPASRIRDLNVGDLFVSQLLFILHDYLHIWAYGTAYELLPSHMGFLRAPISAGNFETYLFCHILSEAVATVGVDYWWLSRVKLDEIIKLGTCCDLLTTSYRAEHDAEYRRLFRARGRETFDTNSLAFFCDLVTFYCTGELIGFGERDMLRSPKLRDWLTQELKYGELQRAYARRWFRFLRDAKVHDDEIAALMGEIPLRERWKQRLMKEVGERLWRKVQASEPMPTPKYPAYEFGSRYPLDLRFMSLRTDADFERAWKDPFIRTTQRKRLVGQLVSRRWRTKISDAHHLELQELLTVDVVKAIASLLAEAPRVSPSSAREPRHVFLLA